MLHALAKFIFFRVMRWNFKGTFPNIKKCVVIVIPHTHWYDFTLGVLVRKVLNLEINYIGKKSLFQAPYGWFFRWTGGTPVDRSKNQKLVDAVAEVFEKKEVFRFALAPEGTRKKVKELKTGFYFIAKKAKVPIVMVAFDFGKKQVKFSELMWTTNHMEADFKKVKEFYKGVKGKIPEYSFD